MLDTIYDRCSWALPWTNSLSFGNQNHSFSSRLIISLAHRKEPAGKIPRSRDGGSLGVSDDVDLVGGVGVSVEQRDSR